MSILCKVYLIVGDIVGMVAENQIKQDPCPHGHSIPIWRWRKLHKINKIQINDAKEIYRNLGREKGMPR